MVTWHAETFDGTWLGGQTLDESWANAQKVIRENGWSLRRLELRQEGQVRKIVADCKAYFLGYRAFVDSAGNQGNDIGIGRDTAEGIVGVEWCSYPSLQFKELEYRSFEQAGFFLLVNP